MNEVTMTDAHQLTVLRDKIREAHGQFINSMKDTMEAGITAGQLLIEAKEELEHGAFIQWIQETMPFTERTAQKYMRIARNQDKLKEKGARLLSEAYNAVNENSEKDYQKQYRENDQIISDEDTFAEVDDDFLKMQDKKVMAPPEELVEERQKADDSLYWYLDDLNRLISGMNAIYRKLAAKRNTATPRYLGYMIGNIHEMAQRLESWRPEAMGDCEECDGKGVLAFQNEHGDIQHSDCPYCINGKVGLSKPTKH